MQAMVAKPCEGRLGGGWASFGPDSPLASADLVSRIELEDAGALGESDLGIKVGAVSPDGQDILVGGITVLLVSFSR